MHAVTPRYLPSIFHMEAAMFATVAGPASVPTGVFLVETAEGLAVDWEWPAERAWGPLVLGSGLHAFVDIARHPEPGEAVRGFVLDFGTLALCQEHGGPWGTPEHRHCTRLKPEPVSVWVDYAREVALLLRVKGDLALKWEPDPFRLRPGRRAGPPRDWALEIERARWAGLLTPEEAQDLLGMVASLRKSGEERTREGERLRESLRALLPKNPKEWEDWLVSRVNEGLDAFPPSLQLGRDPRGEVHPILETPLSVLSGIYVELLKEVCGPGTFAFCSYCGGAYRIKRWPKKGQRRYCPECRAASVPKRLHMRDARAGLSKKRPPG